MTEAFEKWLAESWPGLVDPDDSQQASIRDALHDAFLAGAGWGIDSTGQRVLNKLKQAI